MSGAGVTPVPPPLASPTSTTALNHDFSSSYQHLPGLATPSKQRRHRALADDGSSEAKEASSDGSFLATTTVPIEYQSERQQLTYRIQTVSTRAQLSLHRPASSSVEGEAAGGGEVCEPTPEQIASLLSSDEKSALETDIHMVSAEQLAKRYDTDLQRGLSTQRVLALQLQHGANTLTPPPSRSYLWLFLDQLVAGFSIILWVAAIMIFLSWQPLGSIGGATPQLVNLGVSIVIVIVILISAVFNFTQEVRAAQIVKAFSNMLPSTAVVLRDGREVEVLASELVPGDVVQLVMGDKVPADVRLLSVSGLQLNNSALTGESEPVTCSTHSTSLNYLESHNLGFYSALIVQGRGTGLVTATGDATVLGQVSQLTQTNNSADTNLHREIRRFVLFITVMAFLTGALTFIMWGAWLYRAYPVYMPVASIVVNAFSLIVAYVPDGLPVCVTLTLTMVAKRMYKQKVLAKNLAIIETFNSVSVIATDKTGTLTLNQMTVQRVLWMNSGPNATDAAERVAATADSPSSSSSSSAFISKWAPSAEDVSVDDAGKGAEWAMAQQSCGGSAIARQLFEGAALCNVAEPQQQPDGSTTLSSDAADVALYTLLSAKLGVDVPAQRRLTPRVAVQPFNSTNKCMITLHSTSGGALLAHMKGAPEVILDKCADMAEEQPDGSCRVVELTAAKRAAILATQESCGRDGYRLIGLCKREFAAGSDGHAEYATADASRLPAAGYTFLGLFALLDPPRPNVSDSVRRAHEAGIRVAMVTGDHPSTAQAIAAKVGIVSADCVAAGVRRVRLGRDELDRAVMHMTVDGRVIETHVLGTDPTTPTPDSSTPDSPAPSPTAYHAAPNSPTTDISVSVVQTAVDKSNTTPPRFTAVPQRSSRWSAWWQSKFGPTGASVVRRSPSVPHACVLTGADIAAFDAYMWSWALQHRELVFARTSPEHKLHIVIELQRRGEVVAVTGDGVPHTHTYTHTHTHTRTHTHRHTHSTAQLRPAAALSPRSCNSPLSPLRSPAPSGERRACIEEG